MSFIKKIMNIGYCDQARIPNSLKYFKGYKYYKALEKLLVAILPKIFL